MKKQSPHNDIPFTNKRKAASEAMENFIKHNSEDEITFKNTEEPNSINVQPAQTTVNGRETTPKTFTKFSTPIKINETEFLDSLGKKMKIKFITQVFYSPMLQQIIIIEGGNSFNHSAYFFDAKGEYQKTVLLGTGDLFCFIGPDQKFWCLKRPDRRDRKTNTEIYNWDDLTTSQKILYAYDPPKGAIDLNSNTRYYGPNSIYPKVITGENQTALCFNTYFRVYDKDYNKTQIVTDTIQAMLFIGPILTSVCQSYDDSLSLRLYSFENGLHLFKAFKFKNETEYEKSFEEKEKKIISNKKYSLIMNDRGNSFSRYRTLQLNRYRKVTEQEYGIFLFAKDIKKNYILEIKK